MPSNDFPFFIVGCVRSGTTILRDVLRSHPALFCPEETHVYRWSWPFGTPRYRSLMTQATLCRHHEMNGLDEAAIDRLFESSRSRRDFLEQYMAAAMAAQGKVGRRWFEKTPQNIYGAMLIAEDFPKARFVVIQRPALKVVASLREGSVMQEQAVVGAANYWQEAATLTRGLARAYPQRVLRLSHEQLMRDSGTTLERLARFLHIERTDLFAHDLVKQVVRRPHDHLDAGDLQLVNEVVRRPARASA